MVQGNWFKWFTPNKNANMMKYYARNTKTYVHLNFIIIPLQYTFVSLHCIGWSIDYRFLIKINLKYLVQRIKSILLAFNY